MPGTVAIHPPKEHLGFPFPGHLGEFIHRGNQQRGQAPIDFLVHDQNGQPFSRRSTTAERTISQGVAAVLQGTGASLGIRLDNNVSARIDRRATPGAVSQLGRRTTTTPVSGSRVA